MSDRKRLRALLARFLGRAVEDVPGETPLADLIADSFAYVELVLELEEEHGLRLERSELSAIHTVADLLAAIERHGMWRGPQATER